MRTNESEAAAMLRNLLDVDERRKNEEDREGSTNNLRTVTETAAASDSVDASSTTSTGWDWSTDSTWGMDSW